MGRRAKPTRSSATSRLVVYGGKRPIGIRWRIGQRSGEVSSGTYERDEAIGVQALLLRDLNDGRVPGREATGPAITWAEFRDRYEHQWLQGMSLGSRGGWRAAANHLEALVAPRRLIDVDKHALGRFRAELEALDLRPASVRSYLRAIRAALGWAADEDLIERAPTIRLRRLALSRARSRPITAEEFDRMILAADTERPQDSEQWRRFLRGLWFSGLRLSELARLSHESHDPIRIDGGRLRLIVLTEQKNGRASYLPAPPEFWDLITPGRGLVFPIVGRSRGRAKQMTPFGIGRIIGRLGARAGIVVDPEKGKTATAHDLRRSYLTRVAAVGTMSQTQAMARHSDPGTTAQYYVRHEAEDLARALGWL